MFKMLVGISVMSVVAEFIISETKNQKYIRAIVGVFSFIIILENVFSVNFSIDSSIFEKAERATDFMISEAENNIIEIYEKNIKEELLNNHIGVDYIKVHCDGNLTIRKVKIILEDLSKKDAALSVLIEKFGISEEFIELKG